MGEMAIKLPNPATANELLSFPQVLWAAWLRVDGWYRSGNLAPEPELSVWRLHPEAEIRKLAEELRLGRWMPSPWLQVPYPKKDAQLRHYSMPTVKDQVAFMAHMVLLGPLLDSRIENFAFGNRWYRPVGWNRRLGPEGWVLRPYPFLTNKIYRSYARSHGLYRRVASWTVHRMTGATIDRADFVGPIQLPEDHLEASLPPWTHKDWWAGTIQGERPRTHWAALDLQLAFPSVQLEQLRNALNDMLCCESLDDLGKIHGILGGYPEFILDALAMVQTRQEVACSLVSAIESVRFEGDVIPVDGWRPHHATQNLPPENSGLPTGLAISGLLLNVALHSADRTILQYLYSGANQRRGAFLRFADDMFVFSRSADGLFCLIDEVWRAITGDRRAVLADQESYNLRLNVAKFGPPGIQDVVKQYLKDQGWKKCKDKDCEHIKQHDSTPSNSRPQMPKTLIHWWKEKPGSKEDKTYEALIGKIDRATVGPFEVGPFVTTLVDRLSEIGRDTLAERFGEGAHDHAVRLHDLARLDIDDEQVRPDTRRAFAVNRLVRVWVSSKEADARKDIEEIRSSVESVLKETPWKFALWRAVIRAAARRPGASDFKVDDNKARTWLTRQLGRIAHHDVETLRQGGYNPDVWAQTWPESCAGETHDRNPAWRSLYLSYHRAAFWHALAGEITSLWRHHDRLVRPPIGSTGPSPEEWATRAIPDGRQLAVLEFLGDLDRWVAALYPQPAEELDLPSWPWECDQFVVAVLATLSRSTLAEEWFRCEQPENLLLVPEDALSGRLSKTAALLRRCGRLCTSGRAAHLLTTHALAGVHLGHWDRGLGDFLFPSDGQQPRIDDTAGSVHLVAMAISLGCSASVPTELVSKLVPRPGRMVQEVQGDALKLREYGGLRRILLSREDGLQAWNSKQATLHRLLWGPVLQGDSLAQWRPRPWETPEVGLTTLLSVRLFDSVQQQPLPQDCDPGKGPFTWRLRRSHELLAGGRRLQFGAKRGNSVEKQDKVGARRSRAWEVPPHPAYFLPFIGTTVMGKAPVLDCDDYALYCDVLLLLTALDGGEAILHTLAERGAGSVPFEDRWGWRSRIHLPKTTWEQVERVIRWSGSLSPMASSLSGKLRLSLRGLTRESLGIEHCYLERVDIRLETSHDTEVVRTVSPQGSADKDLPDELWLDTDSETLAENFIVRICQVTEHLEESKVVPGFPAVDSCTAQRIMEQVASAFQSPGRAERGRSPDLVLMPEVSIPVTEVGTLRKLAETEGRASLAGLYWRALKPAYSVSNGSLPARRWFVNEAELVLPIGFGERGPTGSRWFRVRKPVPAHIERGLAQALSEGKPFTWKILGGHRWCRFLHPEWGDFAVAICADLLDAAQWRSLRGELLHLFVVEFNKDVELYQSLTWVRAYETYVNLISVNHGKYGGSFLWTPRRTHSRELASLRGQGLFLTADIEVPVRGLAKVQAQAPSSAICVAKNDWLGCKSLVTTYKAPPPGYERKCFL